MSALYKTCRTAFVCLTVMLAGCASTSAPREPSTAIAQETVGANSQSVLADTPPVLADARLDDSGAEPANTSSQSDDGADEVSSFELGEGDVIEFRMFGQPDMTTTGYVSGAGTVSLPLLQQFRVGGLTPAQAQTRIAQAYRDGGYFQDPQVNITISQYRSQQISVLGEVRQPGRYPLETRTTVLDAIAQAEGITALGAANIVVIRRADGGSQRYRLTMDALINGTNGADGFRLEGGDTVFVPKASLFYIYGEVRRPDAYALRPDMTVMQAISTGGGLTERGSNSRITIQRQINGRSFEIAPELTEVIRAEDVIFVKERLF